MNLYWSILSAGTGSSNHIRFRGSITFATFLPVGASYRACMSQQISICGPISFRTAAMELYILSISARLAVQFHLSNLLGSFASSRSNLIALYPLSTASLATFAYSSGLGLRTEYNWVSQYTFTLSRNFPPNN